MYYKDYLKLRKADPITYGGYCVYRISVPMTPLIYFGSTKNPIKRWKKSKYKHCSELVKYWDYVYIDVLFYGFEKSTAFNCETALIRHERLRGNEYCLNNNLSYGIDVQRKKAKQKAYEQTPQRKAYNKAYNKAYEQTPQRKAYNKAYNKAYQKAYRQTSQHKAYIKAYRERKKQEKLMKEK